MNQVWMASYGLAWIIAIVNALALVAAMWALGRVHLQRDPRAYVLLTDEEGPPLHAALPEFYGLDIAGELFDTTRLRGHEFALLLLSLECPPCDELASVVMPTKRGSLRPAEFMVVMEAPVNEVQAYAKRYRLDCPVIPDVHSEVRARLGVERTPYGVLVDAQGIVRMKGVINDRWQLESLIDRRGQRLDAVAWRPKVKYEDSTPATVTAAGES